MAGDSTEFESSRRTLKALIEERNDLVHHLLTRWDLHDAANCNTLSAELDEQRSRIVAETQKYRAFVNALIETTKELQTFIDSDDGKRYFNITMLQSSRLAMLLSQIAMSHARDDGWTLLSVAGAQLSSLIPKEFEKMKREHGEGSLHKLVTAMDLFDIRSESTPNGGTRAVYRTRK
jgi:hypothetical protein